METSVLNVFLYSGGLLFLLNLIYGLSFIILRNDFDLSSGTGLKPKISKKKFHQFGKVLFSVSLTLAACAICYFIYTYLSLKSRYS